MRPWRSRVPPVSIFLRKNPTVSTIYSQYHGFMKLTEKSENSKNLPIDLPIFVSVSSETAREKKKIAVYVWNWAFIRFLKKLALSLCFQKVLQLQTSLTQVFETKNQKSKNCVLVVKRFLDFPMKVPGSKDNCAIFIIVNILATVSPAVHS